MPFILDDERVNRPVFNIPTSRKWSRSRFFPANRATRYLQMLRRELGQDSVVHLRVAQIEADVRIRTLYTAKAKARRGANPTADISGLVKQALGH